MLELSVFEQVVSIWFHSGMAFTLRTDEELEKALNELVEVEGISRQEIIRRAVLLHSLTNNHALVDGNERLAWLATVVFCDINGYEADLSDEQAFALVWDTASSSQSVENIAEGLHLRPHKADH